MNSNSLPNNRFVRGKKARNLRELAQHIGKEEHKSKNSAAKVLENTRAKEDLKKIKSKEHKVMKKEGWSKEEIDKELDKIEERFPIPCFPDNHEYMYDFFDVMVTVFPPTRRKMDPANLYPTVKPLIDGLTDSGWWADDNFDHLRVICFKYGGVSGERGKYHIKIDITEVGR